MTAAFLLMLAIAVVALAGWWHTLRRLERTTLLTVDLRLRLAAAADREHRLFDAGVKGSPTSLAVSRGTNGKEGP